MNRTRRKFLRWSLLTAVIAAIGAIIWHSTRPEPVEVVIRPIETGPVEKIVVNTRAGTVEACRRTKLSPSVGGQIARLPVKEGDRVSAGKLLLELWNDDLVAQSALAETEAASAESRARSASLQAEVAQREADRQIKLRRSPSASEEQADKTITRANSLRVTTHAILDGKRVFVYLPDRKSIRERNIQTGLSNWEYTEIISGLQPGEQAVVNVDRIGIADKTPALAMKEIP